MSKKVTIIMAQQDYLLGAIEANREQIITAAKHARDEMNADIIVFPELAITGYPPEDLLLRHAFMHRANTAMLAIQHQVKDIYMIIGHPHKVNGQLFNMASVIYNGKVLARYKKQHLPNYSVFDEKRYFHAGRKPCILTIHDIPFGIVVCEDLWQAGVAQQAVEQGAKVLISLNASPFHAKKRRARKDILRERQQTEGAVPIIYVNCVGGQDELVFDGCSFALDATGKVCVQGPRYEPALTPVILETNDHITVHSTTLPPPLEADAIIYQALILATRDYVRKNGFEKVLVGVSGGIDSALTLAIACDALGAKQVEAILLPSRFTSKASIEDAKSQADTMGATHRILSIEPMFTAAMQTLGEAIAHEPVGVTIENLQARCRGVLLMALSNQTGRLLLSTGNKSEMAVGYATLYGDMCGAFAVLKDVLKTHVYRLANYRNQLSPAIPQRVFERPPSAELTHGQTDQDTLPPYEILDEIIVRYVEKDESDIQIIKAGFDKAIVTQIIHLIDKNEYKRRQSAPGVRISSRAFGRDWRLPITSDA